MSNAATALDDREGIAAAIQHYLDGAVSGSSETMSLPFHEGATIYGYIGPDLFGGPIQGLYDWHESNGAAAEMESRIANIDVEGTIATVRLELDNWTGHKFTDMFTLLKTDGQWKIVNKVFYLHPEA